ncbi:MoxR family ATPase [Streptomyces cinnabarinus]|uniref:MoxR family ATPase n=1 Tax=Streptomyces cinnabarinus TaxID=67287 RepID=A0ABY7KSD7_9ACTN|nr:MoxR family ATPase [Streptomyces cinnabarinus]WAZ25866.1 MoxR family ATPase [Streptomyces cinnabarinus]
MDTWSLYRGTGRPLDPAERDRRWPAPPPWRAYSGGPDEPPAPVRDETAARVLGPPGAPRTPDPDEVARVNAALHLRRPLLVGGEPGAGKSALAHRIARELGLGPVLRWPVTGGSTLAEGLYGPAGPGAVRLGPLGTALLPRRLPRVVLVDDLDRGGFDLPDELLAVLHTGEFTVPELLGSGDTMVHTCEPGGIAAVHDGLVRCHEPPLVVATTGGERDLPTGFVRACVRLELPRMTREGLAELARARFPAVPSEILDALVDRATGEPARTGQLLDALHLVATGALGAIREGEEERSAALDTLWSWAAMEGS